MLKKELKQIAKQRLVDALAVAYYKLDDMEEYDTLNDEEKEIVQNYLNELAKRMCKAINEKYVTY